MSLRVVHAIPKRFGRTDLALVALVIALVTVVAPVNADEAPAGRAPSKDGRYVVLLRAPSIATYDGGDPGFPATKPAQGGHLDAKSKAARAYGAHLRSTQRDVAGKVGASVEHSFVIASDGFTADLTVAQATELAADPRVLLVYEDELVRGDTWNTPDFLGMTGKNGAWTKNGGQDKAGSGIVIADLDTGLWPESPSFSGLPLTAGPQTKWHIKRVGTTISMDRADGGVFRGTCQTGEDWTAAQCTTKVVGARYYKAGLLASGGTIPDSEFVSPRDGHGHGSHTASTAAGNIVDNVTVEGRRFGRVSGMAPAAVIAVYKVLWATPGGGNTGAVSDIVAAIDDAVTDGVDVINFSISGAPDSINPIAVAFEGAAEAGVFVAAAGGNNGPGSSTVQNNSPWLTTVAATTHTSFENTLELGNGTKLIGPSFNLTAVPRAPMIRAEDAALAGAETSEAQRCGPGSLDPALVTGRIVVCVVSAPSDDRLAKSAEVARAGGVAMVLINAAFLSDTTVLDYHSLPSVHLGAAARDLLLAYFSLSGTPNAAVSPGNTAGTAAPRPQVAPFSGRGPALAQGGDLLKPDIAAPGVDVLAAVAPPSNNGHAYGLMSGTSMATPHISGLAAFMLGVRPNWTPMQVKSAMMTTATSVKDAQGNASNDVFSAGAGQVTPAAFLDPGLFVTSGAAQWRGFLTSAGMETGTPALDAKDLNGPSMADGGFVGTTSFTRTFTADRGGTWQVSAAVPGFDVSISALQWKAKGSGDSRAITFTFRRTTAPIKEYTKGWVTLTGPTTVRLPVALRPVAGTAPTSVSGSGASGSTTIPIVPGLSGQLPVTPLGLAAAQVTQGTVGVHQETEVCVRAPVGTRAARFDLDADDDADLDLWLYFSDESCAAATNLFASSATFEPGDESITVELPPVSGYFRVQVTGFAAGAAGAPMAFTLRSYVVSEESDAGGLTITPNPVPVTAGNPTSFNLGWSGLTPGERYLGYLDYAGELNGTLIEVVG
jgi:subtilisin family serine protease